MCDLKTVRTKAHFAGKTCDAATKYFAIHKEFVTDKAHTTTTYATTTATIAFAAGESYDKAAGISAEATAKTYAAASEAYAKVAHAHFIDDYYSVTPPRKFYRNGGSITILTTPDHPLSAPSAAYIAADRYKMDLVCKAFAASEAYADAAKAFAAIAKTSDNDTTITDIETIKAYEDAIKNWNAAAQAYLDAANANDNVLKTHNDVINNHDRDELYAIYEQQSAASKTFDTTEPTPAAETIAAAKAYATAIDASHTADKTVDTAKDHAVTIAYITAALAHTIARSYSSGTALAVCENLCIAFAYEDTAKTYERIALNIATTIAKKYDGAIPIATTNYANNSTFLSTIETKALVACTRAVGTTNTISQAYVAAYSRAATRTAATRAPTNNNGTIIALRDTYTATVARVIRIKEFARDHAHPHALGYYHSAYHTAINENAAAGRRNDTTKAYAYAQAQATFEAIQIMDRERFESNRSLK